MAFQGDSIFWVEVEKVVPNPFQPRREFDEAKLKELSESIRMYGVLQPLTVTRRERTRDDGTFYTEYELIAGERRLRASKLADLSQVPVIIRSGEQTEQEKLELAIIENLQREDLNSVDRATAFRQLAEQFKLTHAQIATKMGRSREYVSNTLRLLALPEGMLASLQRGEISEGHARALLMLVDRPEEQDVLFREILMKKISVRESERIARKIATDRIRKKKWKDTDPELIDVERKLTETLGTRVQIKKTDFGGTVSIDYFEQGDLEKLLQAMGVGPGQSGSVDENLTEVAVDDTLYREREEASEIIHKLEENTPLSSVPSDDVAPGAESPRVEPREESLAPKADISAAPVQEGHTAAVPALDTLVTPPAPDDLVTPPAPESIEPPATVQQPEQQNTTPLAQPETTTPTPQPEKPKDDDGDMYSIKNFNI